MKAAFTPAARQAREVQFPTPQSPQSQVNSASSAFQKALRKYKPITNAFHGTLVRDWLEVDDNLGQVMASIANLRERCWLTSRLAAKQKQTQGRGGGINMLRNNRTNLDPNSNCYPKSHVEGTRVDAKMALEDDLSWRYPRLVTARRGHGSSPTHWAAQKRWVGGWTNCCCIIAVNIWLFRHRRFVAFEGI
jgi:hypothetical protein